MRKALRDESQENNMIISELLKPRSSKHLFFCLCVFRSGQKEPSTEQK